MNLDDVNRGIQKHRRRKRLGRGIGSGHGKTCGKGHKGQHSRAGYSRKPVFQGGAMPLVRRVPKRGFNNKFAIRVRILNLAALETSFQDGEDVNLESLLTKSLAKGRFDELKILGNGQLSKKLRVSAHQFSKSAAEKIKKAGGEVVILPSKTPVEAKKRQAKALTNE